MKRMLLSLLLIFVSAIASADWKQSTGWKDIEIFAASNGGTEKDMKAVTPKTVGAYWAGRVTEFYWDKSQNAVSKVRVRVTPPVAG